MGQRLNIEVCNNGEVLANSYYHWSAYTGSALCLLKEVLNAYERSEETDPLRIAVEILQATGAGVNEKEKACISEDDTGRFSGIKFNDAKSRSDGLLSVTEEGMAETRKWEEGLVTVDIGTKKFVFDVVSEMENTDYDECMEEEGAALKLPFADFDFAEPCPFEDVDMFAEAIDNNPDGVRLDEDWVLCWVE